VAAFLVIGWPLGGGVAVALLALLPRWLRRLEPAASRERRRQIDADLPVAMDLLAGCLAAGATAPSALTTVAAALGGPLGDPLDQVAATLRLGGHPALAWQGLGDDELLAPLARTFVRALESGSALGPALDRAARDARARRRRAAEEAARAVAVRAVGPLGACFLPAFVVLGVVPMVWSVASRAFSLGG
jgi:pilus assembly protein TadC